MEGLPPGALHRPGAGRFAGRAGRGLLTDSARRLVLWRHGRTAWNASSRIQGHLDVPLDAVGLNQAAAAAPLLARLDPDALVSSDLLRASGTADALAALTGLPVCPDARLRETHLGSWEGLTAAEAEARFPAEHAAFWAGEAVRRGGGELPTEVAARALAAVCAALPPAGTLVTVTHGGTARALTGALLELPPDCWWRLGGLGNARWSVLLETGRGWRLLAHDVSAPEPAYRMARAQPQPVDCGASQGL